MRRPRWEIEGADWPHRASSRFISAGGIDWHVQLIGQGPALLLLHGTGAASHSWRGLAPLLAEHFTLLIPDLPGHGFTAPPLRESGYRLPAVAQAVAALCDELTVEPAFILGHSAGAAVAIRMTLDGLAVPRAIVSLNGALLPFPGPAAQLREHLKAMVAAGISAYTAFLSVGLLRVMPAHVFNPLIWALPSIVGFAIIMVQLRRYRPVARSG